MEIFIFPYSVNFLVKIKSSRVLREKRYDCKENLSSLSEEREI